MSCDITPISAFQSTNLNSRIDSFSRLADRIVRAIGAPLVAVEAHQDQIFENIAISCEMFSKYAGYTKEYLVLDSNLYERGRGIRLDYLYTLANSKNMSPRSVVLHTTESHSTAPYLMGKDATYVATAPINKALFTLVPDTELSAIFADGLERNVILDNQTYSRVLTAFSTVLPQISTFFTPSHSDKISMNGSVDQNQNTVIYNNMYDYDVMDYRKVASVVDFQEGASSGINTLFTIEQTLAQQTYFSYAMGNYGFDLVSWYTVKQWLDTREKVLATKRSYEFDERSQYLRMYPEPSTSVRFYGVLHCYVERPIRDLIKELWVYQYALALTKITVGTVRSKFSNINLFGGQVFNTEIMQQGIAERDKLEEHLYTNAAGLGDSDPCFFIVG